MTEAEAAVQDEVEPELGPTDSASDDELTAAVALATEQVTGEGDGQQAQPQAAAPLDVEPAPAEEPAAATFDIPAPERPVVAEAEATQPERPELTSVSIWPFFAYDVLWLVFCAVAVWQLLQVPSGTAVFDSEIYPLVLLGGITLTAAGPLLVLASWFAAIGRPGAHKGALFTSALLKGSVATFIGVLMWWGALLVVDQVRLGRLF